MVRNIFSLRNKGQSAKWFMKWFFNDIHDIQLYARRECGNFVLV